VNLFYCEKLKAYGKQMNVAKLQNFKKDLSKSNSLHILGDGSTYVINECKETKTPVWIDSNTLGYKQGPNETRKAQFSPSKTISKSILRQSSWLY
jgi:hypothetical protein